MTETYKGVHWGKYSTKRSDFSGKKGPGPGEYDPHADTKMKPDNLNMRDDDKNKKFDARIPRYHEWVVKEEEKKVGCKRFTRNPLAINYFYIHLLGCCIHI